MSRAWRHGRRPVGQLFVTFFIVLRHRANIARLLQGAEDKV